MASSKALTDAQKRLNAARERRRRLALGPPLSQSDADVTALSQVGPTDMASVEAFVRDAAGEAGVAMLRARRQAQ